MISSTQSPYTLRYKQYETMEFEEACIYRMRKILLDLSSALNTALQNTQNVTIGRKITQQAGVLAWERGLIENLSLFNDIVNIRMETEPSENRDCDNCLQIFIVDQKDAQADIRAIKSALDEERSEHERITEVIMAEIADENSLLEKIKSSHEMDISGELNKSEDEIRKIQEENEAVTKLLESNIVSSKIRVEVTLKAKNLSNERELYKKRSKVEAEYLSSLAKYDTNVGALHRTMQNLTDQLNHLDENLKDFRNELAVQYVEYVELKMERELAILKAFTEDLENFRKNRAAKIIQRAWRSFYERWCMRKKKKSKKRK